MTLRRCSVYETFDGTRIEPNPEGGLVLYSEAKALEDRNKELEQAASLAISMLMMSPDGVVKAVELLRRTLGR